MLVPWKFLLMMMFAIWGVGLAMTVNGPDKGGTDHDHEGETTRMDYNYQSKLIKFARCVCKMIIGKFQTGVSAHSFYSVLDSYSVLPSRLFPFQRPETEKIAVCLPLEWSTTSGHPWDTVTP